MTNWTSGRSLIATTCLGALLGLLGCTQANTPPLSQNPPESTRMSEERAVVATPQPPYTETGAVATEKSPLHGVGEVGALPPSERMVELTELNATQVRHLQAALRKRGIPVRVDGNLGPTTKAGLVAFQKKQGVVANGVITPSTLELLKLSTAEFLPAE